MNEYLVLDVETKKLSTEVKGGWNNIPAFGLAIAVTMDEKGEWEAYEEMNSDVLVSELHKAKKVVTFNGIRFDYEVLKPYGLDPETLYEKSFDILVEMQKVLEHRVSLESVALATFGKGKTAGGSQAVTWFKEGKIDKIIEYCKQDVELTRQIYGFIKRHGFVHYIDKYRGILKCYMPSHRSWA